MIPITVAIPVGSRKEHTNFLSDAVLSVLPQLGYGDELLIVDDGANVQGYGNDDRIRVYETPWRLGDAASHNVCVGVAKNEHVLWLASDDKLLWGCLDAVRASIEAHKKVPAFYWLDVLYDNGDVQRLASGPACVSKAFWRWTGGYPPDLGAGACDSLFISALLDHGYSDKIIHVETPVPMYWHRSHDVRERRHDLGGFSKAWQPLAWPR